MAEDLKDAQMNAIVYPRVWLDHLSAALHNFLSFCCHSGSAALAEMAVQIRSRL